MDEPWKCSVCAAEHRGEDRVCSVCGLAWDLAPFEGIPFDAPVERVPAPSWIVVRELRNAVIDRYRDTASSTVLELREPLLGVEFIANGFFLLIHAACFVGGGAAIPFAWMLFGFPWNVLLLLFLLLLLLIMGAFGLARFSYARELLQKIRTVRVDADGLHLQRGRARWLLPKKDIHSVELRYKHVPHNTIQTVWIRLQDGRAVQWIEPHWQTENAWWVGVRLAHALGVPCYRVTALAELKQWVEGTWLGELESLGLPATAVLEAKTPSKEPSS